MMNDENNEKLDQEFPGLFPHGVWCEDGWFGLIHDLAVEITRVAQRDGLEIRAERVQQKYGTLRVYLNTAAPPDIERAIDLAEERSLVTCEATGRPGVLCEDQRGWLKVLSPEVAAERGFRPLLDPNL